MFLLDITTVTLSVFIYLLAPIFSLHLVRFLRGWRCLILLPVFAKNAGQEPANPLLVDLVLRVLAGRNVLGQRRAASEDTEIRNRSCGGPVPPATSVVGSPSIQRDPDRLLGSEVGVAGELPQTSGIETAIELGARIAGLWFGGALVFSLGLVEIPLLLVGNEFDGDKGDEEAGDSRVYGGDGGVDARGEQEQVGWCRDGPEKDLSD